MSYDLFEYVDGTIKELIQFPQIAGEKTLNHEYYTWRNKNCFDMSYLNATLPDHVSRSIIGFSTAREFGYIFRNRYFDSSQLVNLYFIVSSTRLKEDLDTKEVLDEGLVKDNLYTLTSLQASQVAAHSASLHSSDPRHRKLGHTSSTIIHKVASPAGISINTSSSSQLCTSCQLGKHQRIPFYHSTRVTTEPLYLIYCDIWGPAPVPSSLEFKYYILFVDDFSRFHWIYPLKTRDESVEYFKHFKNMSENLLSTSIKLFQCDGALELVKEKFKIL